MTLVSITINMSQSPAIPMGKKVELHAFRLLCTAAPPQTWMLVLTISCCITSRYTVDISEKIKVIKTWKRFSSCMVLSGLTFILKSWEIVFRIQCMFGLIVKFVKFRQHLYNFVNLQSLIFVNVFGNPNIALN